MRQRLTHINYIALVGYPSDPLARPDDGVMDSSTGPCRLSSRRGASTPSAHTGEAIYRRCGRQHHHHLICRTCGRTLEVEGPAVERWADRIAAENGFVDVSHTLDVFGTCSDCTAEAVPPSVTPHDRSTA